MKPEYILEKVEDKATLYHLKVKDSNNLMVETNLFFDLKKHSWAYDSFVISQSDDEYIHNFKGLAIAELIRNSGVAFTPIIVHPINCHKVNTMALGNRIRMNTIKKAS